MWTWVWSVALQGGKDHRVGAQPSGRPPISKHKALGSVYGPNLWAQSTGSGMGDRTKRKKKGENAEEDHISEASFGLYTEFYFSLF